MRGTTGGEIGKDRDEIICLQYTWCGVYNEVLTGKEDAVDELVAVLQKLMR